MSTLNGWLADYPSTNARMAVSLCLSVIFVISVMIGMFAGRAIDNDVIWTVAGFILTLDGIGAAQFGVKRKTEFPTPVDPADNGGAS